ncbi:hypothetical protein MITS9509_01556 [Synechococcus sp. MIT S9509]|uniref:hypothetical protein n=1 Tax=unclassified Synechococcus TaxID=2626047 RepID=UPI0007BB030A|nr:MULTISPECIES: hypothetical protein [unclassified Synechococcus]KZR88116.1 hypothetical protein MITS9504_00544 [Synechococcus sp. MIT S9504]KZR92099.1 hypothetical protein MITS9509_01556 [Synechococcus sp. MIT S9509]
MKSIKGRQSTDNAQIQALTQSAAARFAQPLPAVPDYGFQADVQNDLKLAALLCAIRQIADQRGTTVIDQLDTWEAG